ncbi:MAG: MmcQ/YjbR family DNA-binding protein [Bacteroidota bacterium]|nr:MmcQ/YjbR family DNA-binding protein [Bacteroidota bacterium]
MLDIETYRNYCISKKGVTEEFPFDNETLVFKVCGKMFALASITQFKSINLKCDPEEAIDLRERYDAVQPGYHMNKQHWNTIIIDGTLPLKFLLQQIDNSYNLVMKSLPKKVREGLV